MKTSTPISQIRATAAALALLGTLFWGGTASAAGIASGTIISNLATLSYSVGGTSQPNIGSSAGGNTSGAGTATTFVVDNKVNLSVLEVAGAVTSVAPGSSNNVATFTVTNTGNTPQGYTLAALNQALTTPIAGVADGFDVTGIQVFVENGTTAGFQAAEDNAVFISTLAAEATITVYVLANIPVLQANGTQANITLTATTKTAGLTLVAANAESYSQSVVADTAGVDIVFADAATSEANFVGESAARNGQGTARDAYRVAAAVISVLKTSTLLCDPFNFTTNPKHIPGAIVRWTITIGNDAGASASATLATVGDTLDGNTLHDANLVVPTATVCNSAVPPGTAESLAGRGFQVESSVAGRALGGQGGTGYMTNGSDNDGASITGQAVIIDYLTAIPAGGGHTAGELKPGESVTVTFNTTIQ